MKNCQKSAIFGAMIVLLLPVSFGYAQSPTPLPVIPTAPRPAPTTPAEMRGLWIVRTDLTSPASIQRVVTLAKRHGFNALFVQIRGRGDAYYQSSLEPRAESLAGQPASFDPLATIITEGHAAGLQIHAWMNACYVWGAPQKPLSPLHVVNAHPDWLMRDAHNHVQMDGSEMCEGAYLSPANLAACQHIHDVFLDVATRYDVDGIHFDYIRYPNDGYDYSVMALLRFQALMEPHLTSAQRLHLAAREAHDRLAWPHTFPAQWQQFRRQQVTNLVGWISQDIKAIKPWVIISAAVSADSQEALGPRAQDWMTWLRRGYLDAVVPEAYGQSTAKVSAQIAAAVAIARASGRYVYAGIGSWRIPAASTAAKIAAARADGAQGCVLFSYGGITHDGASATYLNALAARSFPHPAALPIMAWLPPHPAPTTASAPRLFRPNEQQSHEENSGILTSSASKP
jgi:uncharacterized lipoprotein YddW (UPF0748 family)